ncbi:MAG: uroporphyrinogen decarboxylase [Chloroflexi bacterium]|nr:uroporphyrinogen decarboxylase [Chloroflexota bacterium]
MATTREMTGAERMLAACHLQPVDATPIWFMRQAGRCFPEYRKLREKYEILTIAKTPELCVQVTLLPVKRLHVDAAVIFADIMLPLEGMGVPFRIEPDIGPIIPHPIRTQGDVDKVRVIEAEEATPYVFEAIKLIGKELGDTAALVGFSGSPFTMACYMIEGQPSRDYARAKALMLGQPDLWHRLMDKVTEVVVRYLRGQVTAGIQVAQLFDSWVGILSPQQYKEFVLPYSQRIFAEMRDIGIPTIHFGTGAAALLELMASAGSNLIGVDWRVPLDRAWSQIGYNRGIQGNLDPTMLLAPFQVTREGARDILEMAGGRPGHIFNLGHGVLPDTNPDDLARLVEFVHEESSRNGPGAPHKTDLN